MTPRTRHQKPPSTPAELRKAATSLREERNRFAAKVEVQAQQIAELKAYARHLERLIEQALPALHAVDIEGVPEVVTSFRKEMCGAWHFRDGLNHSPTTPESKLHGRIGQ